MREERSPPISHLLWTIYSPQDRRSSLVWQGMAAERVRREGSRDRSRQESPRNLNVPTLAAELPRRSIVASVSVCDSPGMAGGPYPPLRVFLSVSCRMAIS
jgi:hypothetical protein